LHGFETEDTKIYLTTLNCHKTIGTYVAVRFEDFMAVTMKNAVFWYIDTQFEPHRKHITSLLHSSAGKI
jgi:NADH dehydrogenase FAD-containing subunit